jgi:hypothetical protein
MMVVVACEGVCATEPGTAQRQTSGPSSGNRVLKIGKGSVGGGAVLGQPVTSLLLVAGVGLPLR